MLTLLRQLKEAMTMRLSELKKELMHFGAENDAHETERARRMLNITPDTGEFLSVLVRFGTARRVLEIGTSNGYSTLWLAEATAAIDGHVTTLEFAEDKVAMARSTLRAAGWPRTSRWCMAMPGSGWQRPAKAASTCCSWIRTAGSTPAGGRNCAACCGQGPAGCGQRHLARGRDETLVPAAGCRSGLQHQRGAGGQRRTAGRAQRLIATPQTWSDPFSRGKGSDPYKAPL